MVTTLPYESGLSIGEAETQYLEARRTFETVRSHYSWWHIAWRRDMKQEDVEQLKNLKDYAIRRLKDEKAVWQQVEQARTMPVERGLLLNKLTQLESDIWEYEVKFRNTGVMRGGCD